MATLKTPYDAKSEMALMKELWSDEIKDNPYNFVMFNFPWGKEGTPLANFKGPRPWQKDELLKMAAHIKLQKENMKKGIPCEVYKSATVSGRGPGKSAMVAWLTLWMQSCVLGSMVVITANTEAQLKTKTIAELGKWHTLALNSHWFERMALSLKPLPWFTEILKTQLKLDTGYYYAEALLWNADNPDAFAGAHNFNGTMLIYDEASGIPDVIWQVSTGFFTELVPYRFWFVFSNPRRNSGPFFEIFHKHRNLWPNRRHIDSRTIEGIDVKALEDIVNRYGEDSDQAKIEVKGEFPSHGDNQFISREIVEGAVHRDLEYDEYASLIMGVDPARYGRDATAIYFRRGRDARTIPSISLERKDNMQVANECARLIDLYNPDGVFIDAGNGTGIIDRLKEMGYQVREVWFGGKSDKPEYANKRTEMWADMRDWLKGGCIKDDSDLFDDLVGPNYYFKGAGDQVMLESKEEMHKRGLPSPDKADALACTFFERVARKDSTTSRRGGPANRFRVASGTGSEYDPFGG